MHVLFSELLRDVIGILFSITLLVFVLPFVESRFFWVAVIAFSAAISISTVFVVFDISHIVRRCKRSRSLWDDVNKDA